MNPHTQRLAASRTVKRLISLVASSRYAVLLVLMAHTAALLAQTPQQEAWNILCAGVHEKSTGKRTQAVRALRLLPGDPEATDMAQKALQDQKPEVRAAAATALGLIGSKESIPELKKALADRKPAVALAAAHALQLLNDPAGYEVYYEVLTGERKSADGLVAQQMQTLKDGKKMAALSFEEGLGFLPFGDIGFSAVKAVRKDDTSPVRAAAARALINNQDPRVGQALVRAASDKSWIVRASALLAIAKREDPELLDAIVPELSDKNGVARYTAAAAVIRLTTVAERNKDVKATSKAPGGRIAVQQTHSEAPVTGMVGSNAFGETPTNQTKY
jgi:HEAT repeat protein